MRAVATRDHAWLVRYATRRSFASLRPGMFVLAESDPAITGSVVR